MNFFIVLIIVGVALIIWGVFRLTNVKGSFLIGWRGYQERKKEQKK